MIAPEDTATIDEEIVMRAKTLRMITGTYQAARIAITIARTYEWEGDTARSPRVRAVLDQIGAYRRFIRSLRVLLSLQAEDIGTASTLPAPACPMVMPCIDGAPTCPTCQVAEEAAQ